jgi:hypothetical protein
MREHWEHQSEAFGNRQEWCEPANAESTPSTKMFSCPLNFLRRAAHICLEAKEESPFESDRPVESIVGHKILAAEKPDYERDQAHRQPDPPTNGVNAPVARLAPRLSSPLRSFVHILKRTADVRRRPRTSSRAQHG